MTDVAAPSLTEVRSRVAAFGSGDRSYDVLRAATGTTIDLARRAHREALHRWLNAWGCRIAYSAPGGPNHFDEAMARWWRTDRGVLEGIDRPLSRLTRSQVRDLGAAFERLSRSKVAASARGARTLGPTAAAKALYALRPASVMPWDLEIAAQLHGARDGAAFARHLTLGREWARSLLAEAGMTERALLADLGRPEATLAKLLDEYCYVRYTRGI